MNYIDTRIPDLGYMWGSNPLFEIQLIKTPPRLAGLNMKLDREEMLLLTFHLRNFSPSICYYFQTRI